MFRRLRYALFQMRVRLYDWRHRNDCVHCGTKLTKANFGCDLGWYGKECAACMNYMDEAYSDKP